MIKTPRILLVCGSGGVGKTTLSASLGLKHASLGLKTLVITIDPAKRLANALGLKSITTTRKKVYAHPKTQGEMWAMMLDTKSTFDDLIKKYSPTSEKKNTILNNVIYHNLSNMISGSQEYMAMEKLFEIWNQNEFDLIVIDTPPVQNAIDFLEAPQKMTNMIDQSLVKWLAQPSANLKKSGWSFFEKGSKSILKILSRITGMEFFNDMMDFFTAFQELMQGFKERAKKIQTLLQSNQSEFYLVCCPENASLQDIHGFVEKMQEQNYFLKHILLNRFYSGHLFDDKTLHEDFLKLKISLDEKTATAWIENYKNYQSLIEKSLKTKAQLEKQFPKLDLTTLSLFTADVHSLEGLQLIADRI